MENTRNDKMPSERAVTTLTVVWIGLLMLSFAGHYKNGIMRVLADGFAGPFAMGMLVAAVFSGICQARRLILPIILGGIIFVVWNCPKDNYQWNRMANVPVQHGEPGLRS